MNNLHRKLAPISDAAWAEIEQEAARTLKRHLGGRKVVDVNGPKGFDLSAIGTGHVERIDGPADGVHAVRREVRPLVELRVPFTLSRQAIDDVERGSLDSDWEPLKEAARRIAFAEDSVIFDGYVAAGIRGIREEASNAAVTLPADVAAYPLAVAQAVSRLRLAGVEGPYALVLGQSAYTLASGGSDDGYPILEHVERMVEGGVIWAPGIEGGLVLSTRGGDFELDLGQDFSIGYQSHDAASVTLYLQESLTFRTLTTEAAVRLDNAPAKR
ncbi:bacteriocin [Verticiella sediminum]|uniref:Bacteriocin n=1 Tax=Verticiella sediminum TaxID=1247510 RepID=A0A556ARE5_9BURK|nr:family 1 encapsulin nanocompartment shell protein [Verticiella sediminum]TSH94965.1 bacteriocin [Verticiella sediminum]